MPAKQFGAPLPRATTDLVQHFEGRYLTTYLCPAGVPTIGYGHTGPDVLPGLTISADLADELLAQDLDAAADDVDRLVRVPLTPEQRGALTSFVFNLGAGALASSTLLKLLNAGDLDGAAGQFGKWVHAGGRILPGLVARRAAEEAMFRGRDWRAQLEPGQHHPQPQMCAAPSGDDDDRVRRIQRLLGVKVDGVYGPATRAAVKQWQAARRLVADGIVGPKTAAAMGIG